MNYRINTILTIIIVVIVVSAASGETEKAKYTKHTVKNSQFIKNVTLESGNTGLDLLEKINRRDRRHMKKGVVLHVPDYSLDLLQFSPFPDELKSIEFAPKALLVSLRIQAFGAYEFGKLVYWGPVCTGNQEQETPANLYYTNWRSRRKRSTINRNWIMNWYFNIHTSMGLAFHQYAMPGEPASYGCIRLLSKDSRWIYDWADQWIPSSNPAQPKAWGTPIIAFGRYDYSSAPPWNNLSENPSAGNVTSEELEKAVERYLWIIQKRTQDRKDLLDRKSQTD